MESFVKGITTVHMDAIPISGRMSIQHQMNDASAVSGEDMELGEPEIRIVAYEVPILDWVEVIYV